MVLDVAWLVIYDDRTPCQELWGNGCSRADVCLEDLMNDGSLRLSKEEIRNYNEVLSNCLASGRC